MVVNLKAKKRLASRVTGVGVHRIRFDSDHLDDVADAITRENIRSLITANTIQIKSFTGTSRGRAQNKKDQKKKTLKKSQPATPKTAKPAPVKTKAKSPEKKNDDTDPLEQAEVYITYGLHKQAVDLLKEYLEKNPADKTAIELLAKAQAGIQQ